MSNDKVKLTETEEMIRYVDESSMKAAYTAVMSSSVATRSIVRGLVAVLEEKGITDLEEVMAAIEAEHEKSLDELRELGYVIPNGADANIDLRDWAGGGRRGGEMAPPSQN